MSRIFGDIRFLRGLDATIPVFAEGQPAITTDTKRVFVGSADGNVELAKKDSVDLLEMSLAESASHMGVLLDADFPRLSGESDDAPRINRAIQYAFDNSKGFVRFLPKTYEIASTINLKTGVSFYGMGYGDNGTLLKRTANVVAIKGEGQSVLIANAVRVTDVEFQSIKFHGNDYSADYMQLIACAMIQFYSCNFYGMTGRQILAHELMDSRFITTDFNWGGSADGTLAAITLKSENGYEYTNQLHFVGCRFESYNGTAIDTIGNNTNEIFFTDCKFESSFSNQIHLKLDNCTNIFVDGIQLTSLGSTGNTIPSQISATNTKGIMGTIMMEHGQQANTATLTRFIKMDNVEGVDLFVFVYGGDQLITDSCIVNVINSGAVSVRGAIRGTNALNKGICNSSISFSSGNTSIVDKTETAMSLQLLGTSDKWYHGRISVDGSGTKYRFMRNEDEIYRVDNNSDFRMKKNLFCDNAFYLPKLSANPWFDATNSPLWIDSAGNLKVTINGVVKTVTVT